VQQRRLELGARGQSEGHHPIRARASNVHAHSGHCQCCNIPHPLFCNNYQDPPRLASLRSVVWPVAIQRCALQFYATATTFAALALSTEAFGGGSDIPTMYVCVVCAFDPTASHIFFLLLRRKPTALA
jgi:hypothetical protein